LSTASHLADPSTLPSCPTRRSSDLRVIDLRDETVVDDHDGAAEPGAEAGTIVVTVVSEDEVWLGLEAVVGMCTGSLDDALRMGFCGSAGERGGRENEGSERAI